MTPQSNGTCAGCGTCAATSPQRRKTRRSDSVCRLAAGATQVRGHRRPRHETIGRYDANTGTKEGSHTSPCVTGDDER